MFSSKDILGLKFPDEMLIRFFYKEGIFQNIGSVLEIGCDNGSNLQLFSEYGFSVVGVDISPTAISNANRNFEILGRRNYKFFCADMRDFIKTVQCEFDILLFPSSLYYVRKNEIKEFLTQLKRIIRLGQKFYFRMRAKDDYRNKRLLDEDVVDFHETGEFGCTLSFYDQDEFLHVLKETINPSKITYLSAKFENMQNGHKIKNSDFIVCGSI